MIPSRCGKGARSYHATVSFLLEHPTSLWSGYHARSGNCRGDTTWACLCYHSLRLPQAKIWQLTTFGPLCFPWRLVCIPPRGFFALSEPRCSRGLNQDSPLWRNNTNRALHLIRYSISPERHIAFPPFEHACTRSILFRP